MRRWFVLFLALLFLAGLNSIALSRGPVHKTIPRFNHVTKSWVNVADVPIDSIQWVPDDSLQVAQDLQLSSVPNKLRGELAITSRYWHDTVVSTLGIVVVAPAMDDPHGGIYYTQRGWTFLLHDTTSKNEWAGLFVRMGYIGDSALMRARGFDKIKIGDLVRVTGVVVNYPEFDATTISGPTPVFTSEFVPDTAYDITRISFDNPIPAPTVLPVSALCTGRPGSGGTINFLNGRKYQTSLVRLENVTVGQSVDATRGTFWMYDDFNNQISDYDISYYFSYTNSEVPPLTGSPDYTIPPPFSVLNYIQGALWTTIQNANTYGYRIAPLLPGDWEFGVSKPTINTQRRYPVVVTDQDYPSVSVKAIQTTGGYPLATVKLYASIDNQPFVEYPMTVPPNDSIYTNNTAFHDEGGYPLPAGSFVKYYFIATDTSGVSQICANASDAASDTTAGYFFYTVSPFGQPVTLRDIQYTPYVNGRSSLVGAGVAVRGVVTASTKELKVTDRYGTNKSLFIQSGTDPWSGLWVVKDTLALPNIESLSIGDSVEFDGYIGEYNDNTRLVDTAFTLFTHNRPIPAAHVIDSTFAFDVPARFSDPNIEQWEGMLIRFVGVTLADTAVNAVNDKYEIAVGGLGGGKGRIRLDDGIHHYSVLPGDTAAGATILSLNDPVDTVTGVEFYSGSRYWMVPRVHSDIVAGDHETYTQGWNMVSVSRYQGGYDTIYDKSFQFPGVTGQAYYYNNGYQGTNTMYPGTGYWVKFPSAKMYRRLGIPLNNDTIPLVKGWNMVGAPGDSMPVSSAIALPAGNHLSSFFGYTRAYAPAAKLMPGFGYWVKSDSNGSFVERKSDMFPRAVPQSGQSGWNTITIADAAGNSQTLYFAYDPKGATINVRDYEMPPPFVPDFDARYASGRVLEAFTDADLSSLKSYPIQVHNASGIATISWNIVDGGNMSYSIGDDAGGKILPATAVKGAGSVSRVKIGDGRLMLKINGGAAVPQTYFLSQNYPNPFNPATRMQVGLPEASHLTVKIYNVLGQAVRTLVDEDRPAGTQTIVWNSTAQNGASVASGLYFVRMDARPSNGGQANAFSQVRKIMLLK